MLQLSRWKVILVVFSAIFGILFTLPNLLPASVNLPGWVPNQRLNLGLDLQGGSYLLLEVDTNALKKERLVNLTEDVRTNLRNASIDFTGLGQAGDSVSVRITDPAKLDDAYGLLAKLAQPIVGGGGRDLSISRESDQRIVLTYVNAALRAQSIKAVEQSIEIVRRRIDQLGTKEPSITTEGSNRIVIQAPGESDPERLKNIIGKTAKLTFQMVDDTVTPEQVAGGLIPPGSEALPDEEQAGAPLVVRKRAVVTGEMLTNASQGFDQSQRPDINFRFNSVGARRFGDTTSQNIGKRFAIVLDGKVISAPVIQSAITGGSGQITGNFTVESSNDLAVLLRAGALPAPLVTIQQNTVGAELGADAVRAGAISTLVGFLAIIVFMFLSYGFIFGGASILGLILNVLMIIGFMSMTQATLTLPGVAGLILTLAVAVDANVLIYERVRDEERTGHGALMAVDVGFRRASVSILDANVTTLISAIIMYMFGAGPVKGFAWTLGVGVFTSVFTAMLVSQVILGAWFKYTRPKTLPI